MAALITLGMGAEDARAQPPAPGDAPAHRGHAGSTAPDWNGIWVIAGTFMDKQDGKEVAAPGRAGERHSLSFALKGPELKDTYLETFQAVSRRDASGKVVDEGGARCLPQGMPRFWGGPYAFEILQTRNQINIAQEWNEQTRRIYLDGRPHPPDIDPSYNGHSIGHWEGNVLMIDTVGLREQNNGSALAHSDALHLVEHVKQVALDMLEVDITGDDPKAFQKPWQTMRLLHRKSGMEMEEYVCEESNRNTVNGQGHTQTLLPPGH